ncbi:hypothetical protein BOX15_Mlig024909g2, partial [Macrostomum lignano]
HTTVPPSSGRPNGGLPIVVIIDDEEDTDDHNHNSSRGNGSAIRNNGHGVGNGRWTIGVRNSPNVANVARQQSSNSNGINSRQSRNVVSWNSTVYNGDDDDVQIVDAPSRPVVPPTVLVSPAAPTVTGAASATRSLIRCPIAACKSAGGRFPSDRVLAEHLLAFHLNSRMACTACAASMLFNTADAAVAHCELKHSASLAGLVDQSLVSSAPASTAAAAAATNSSAAVATDTGADSDIEIVNEEKPLAPRFACEKCSFTCDSQRRYFAHCSTHKELCFQCSFCSFVCRTYHEIVSHRRQAHANIQPLYSCRYFCGHRSAKRETLASHEAACTKRQRRYDCLRCAFATVSEAAWRQHLASRSHADRMIKRPVNIKVHRFTGQMRLNGEDYKPPKS